jgi:molybdopterin synthase sulfur carrier subunit
VANVTTTRNLRRFFPDMPSESFEVQAATLKELIRELERRFPGVATYLCDDAGVQRKHVALYIDNELIRDPTLGVVLAPSSAVFVAQALSGG